MAFRVALAAAVLVAGLPATASPAAAQVSPAPALQLRTVASSTGRGAGTSLAQTAWALAYRDGVLYSTDSRTVRALDVATGQQAPVVGHGLPSRWNSERAETLRLNGVRGLAVDAQRRISVTVDDTSGGRILRADPDGTVTEPLSFSDPELDSMPARDTLRYPGPLAQGPDGTLYFETHEGGYHRVYAMKDGVRRHVAGGGSSSGCAVGAATSISFFQFHAMAVDGAGRLLISADYCVRRLEPSGQLVRVAGGEADGSSNYTDRGDGGPALAARLNAGYVATDGDVLYVVDYPRVRKVDAAGVITTVAGSGTRRDAMEGADPLTSEEAGDGRPATQVDISPGVLAAGDGQLWFYDHGTRRLRVVRDGALGTVAGNGDRMSGGDGGQALEAQLASPSDVALLPGGGYVVTSDIAKRVRKVDASGTVSTIAGTGGHGGPDSRWGESGDGGPAVDAGIGDARSVAAGPDGSVYIGTWRTVRRVSPDGVITLVAGNRTYDPPVDGVPGTQSSLSAAAIDVGPDGSVYVAAYGTHSVRRVRPDGVIETIAGGNGPGYSGDGGPAALAKMSSPIDIDVLPDGSYYVAEEGNARVRYVNAAGVITTVAGNGESMSYGANGDGGLATAAPIAQITSIAAAPDGTLYVSSAQMIRAVRAGIITTVAGRFEPYPEPSGDAVASRREPLMWANGLVATPAGLMVAERSAARIRLLLADVVPAAPAAVTAIPGSRRVVVRWTAPPEYGGSPVDTYTVTATPADGSPAVSHKVPAHVRQTRLIGLRNGVDHAVEVRATNAAGSGPPRSTTARPRADLPGPPRYASARPGSGSADVSWMRPDDGGGTLDRYRVTAQPGGATVEVEGDTTRTTFGGLANGTAYRFTVTARNDSGWGPESAATEPVVPDGPPAPAFVTSGVLTAHQSIRFAEPVRDVTPRNVVLRTGTQVVAADLVCANAAGATVVCGEDALSSVTVRPRSSLLPGAPYELLLNPPGEMPVVDMDGVAAAYARRPFRASTSEQETTVGGRRLWRRVNDSRAEGGQYAVERQFGARATARVTGTRVTWLTAVGPDMGRAEVWVDGVRKATFDNRAAVHAWRVPRTVTGLSNTTHTVEVRVLGGGYVVVDSLGAPVTFEWRRVGAASASGGAYALAELAGAETTFTFRGTGLDWYGVRGPGYGRVAVYVDGQRLADVDYYAATTSYGYRRSVGALPDGVHTVRLVVLGTRSAASKGTAFGLDRWQVTG